MKPYVRLIPLSVIFFGVSFFCSATEKVGMIKSIGDVVYSAGQIVRLGIAGATAGGILAAVVMLPSVCRATRGMRPGRGWEIMFRVQDVVCHRAKLGGVFGAGLGLGRGSSKCESINSYEK